METASHACLKPGFKPLSPMAKRYLGDVYVPIVYFPVRDGWGCLNPTDPIDWGPNPPGTYSVRHLQELRGFQVFRSLSRVIPLAKEMGIPDSVSFLDTSG
jgi:hypothetical protein